MGLEAQSRALEQNQYRERKQTQADACQDSTWRNPIQEKARASRYHCAADGVGQREAGGSGYQIQNSGSKRAPLYASTSSSFESSLQAL